jgi:acetylornithine deacetylase/succinyl-diaminopimelate desuccinylase-like protein
LNPDWTQIEAETVAQLQALIRFDTTNPPGNELPLAQHIAGELDKAGIENQLLVPTEGRAALIGRLRGNGSKRPILLLAHMDVVGVEADKWSCDPFGGVLQDGYVYGRGAIDDKGMLAANLVTMLLLRRTLGSGAEPLQRDIVFIATSDEEAGGEWGIRWIGEQHADLLDAEFGINEGGRTRIIEDGRRYLAIQTAEKISHLVTLTARGPAGHAAVPLPDNSIMQLARALARLSHYLEPVTLTETTRQFFAELSRIWPNERESVAMRTLAAGSPNAVADAATLLSSTPVFNAVIRNGFSATLLSSGIVGNVIPAEATAVLNVRTLPGQSIEDVVSRLSAIADEPSVELTVAAKGEEAPPSDSSSAMFAAIAKSARELDPELAVVPYLSTGVTDSAYLRRLGVSCYGILPFPMERGDEERMHGHDERIPIASLHFGTRLIYESVRRVAFDAIR